MLALLLMCSCVQMFCKLVLKGNPKLIEPLFSTHLCYDSEDWLELQKVRNSFLSKSVILQYLSYVHSQLKGIFLLLTLPLFFFFSYT